MHCVRAHPRPALLGVTVVALWCTVAGCGTTAGESSDMPETTTTGTTEATSTAAPTPEGRDQLTIVVRGQGDPRVMTLTCDPPGGKHPTPDLACGALEHWLQAESGESTTACPLPLGGTERATIRGRYAGEALDIVVTQDRCGRPAWAALLSVIAPPAAFAE